MKARLAAACTLLLAGCAQHPTAPAVRYLTPEEAQQMPVANLCLGVSTYRPYNAEIAAQELRRRGVNCQDHAAAINGVQQRQAQEDGAILQHLLNQPVATPPPRVTCQTYRIGTALQTYCN